MNVKYAPGEKIDIAEVGKYSDTEWFSQTLCEVNDSLIRVGFVEGELPWHKHDNSDEFFLCLSGKLIVDIEDKTIELAPHEGVTVSKGVMHRTRAYERTSMLMSETKTVGDVMGD